MPSKRPAEDSPEQVLTAMSSKKRRISDADAAAQPTELNAAGDVSAEGLSAETKRQKRRQKAKEKAAAAAAEEVQKAGDAGVTVARVSDGESAVEAVATPAKKSKEKTKEATEPTATGGSENIAIDTSGLTRKERKALKKAQKQQGEEGSNQHKQPKKQQAVHSAPSSPQKQQKKAKKNGSNHKKTKSASVDIETLRNEIRKEVRRELQQQEEKRNRESKDNKVIAQTTKAIAVPAEPEIEMQEDDDSSKNVEADAASKGLVRPSCSNKGPKPTSDSLQMAQLDAALASIDLTRFSKSLQDKLRQLQSLEWRKSDAVGGRILNIDSIFSPGEEYIMVAYPSYVKIFVTKTSILLRTLPVDDGDISDMTLSADDTVLLISSTSGHVEHWNWLVGERLSITDMGSSVASVAVDSQNVQHIPGTNHLFTVQNDAVRKKWVMQSTLLGSKAQKMHSEVILECFERISKPRVLDNGKLIIATAARRILVGIAQLDLNERASASPAYIWHELDCPDTIMCADAYLVDGPRVDAHVAVGTSGPIYLYRNLVSQLQAVSRKKSSARPSVQKLHWHRYPVGAVKFSKDGNYLVSGGFETVLCNWQLDTGRRSDLPHLTAPIEGLVISPNGASYAVTLGNNSLLVLSTLDLEPSLAITGPAWPATVGHTSMKKQAIPTYPATLRKHSLPPQIILATPSSSSVGAPTSAVYLQTLDARTGTQLEKQALTRTNVTDRVSDPEGKILGEPDVTHLAVSQDGNWLATAEYWQPPASEFEFLAENGGAANGFARSRRECFLKLWLRNEEKQTWQLSSRIDSPHEDGPQRVEKIMDLVAESDGFVTVGGDGQVKVWRQQKRYRDGVEVKDKTGATLTSWFCARSIAPLSPPVVGDATDALVSAKLSLAADNTLLVAVFKYKFSTVVNLINHADGSLILSRSDLPVEGLVGAAIVDRYLVILSEQLIVWDIVQDRLQFSYRLRSTRRSQHALQTVLHLATHQSGNFAIVVPSEDGEGSEVVIFDPANAEPLMTWELPHLVRSLLPAEGKLGFFVIDTVAQIHYLHRPQSSLRTLLSMEELAPTETEVSQLGAESSGLVSSPFANLASKSSGADESGRALTAESKSLQKATGSDQGEPRFTQASLAEIFEKQRSHAQGGTMSLFEKIADLAIGRKPGRAAA